MSAETICMKAGDRRPFLLVALSIKNAPSSNPLTGAVGVRFRMVNRKTGAVKIDNAVASIDSVPTRTVVYQWASGDTDEPGLYDGWFIVDYGGGVVQSFPACGSITVHIE